MTLPRQAMEQMQAEAWLEAKRRHRTLRQRAQELGTWPQLRTPQVEAWLAAGAPSASDRKRYEAAKPTTGYFNRFTRKFYAPHTLEEWKFITEDAPRWWLLKGGWRSGKSVALVIKLLERLRRGCPSIMVSPDTPHFRRSLWMEFERWCPWHLVSRHWVSRGIIEFRTGGLLLYGGIDDPTAWEGPTANFVAFDEARRKEPDTQGKKQGDEAMKVLMSRASVTGPNGEPAQLALATTPAMHWLNRYFGGVGPAGIIRQGPEAMGGNDPLANFKAEARVTTLDSEDNAANLTDGYIEKLSTGLTEEERRVNLGAEWLELGTSTHFLPSMQIWDQARETIPPLDRKTQLVVAADAAVGRLSGMPDCFGLLGVSRHWSRHDDVAVRLTRKWQARPGTQLDFHADDGPIATLRAWCRDYSVITVVYDPHQLHSDMTALNKENVAWMQEFSQGDKRLDADRALFDLILRKGCAHDGDPDLREHIANANKKMDADGRRLRIVKRDDGLKIDLAVCLAMAAFEILRLNV